MPTRVRYGTLGARDAIESSVFEDGYYPNAVIADLQGAQTLLQPNWIEFTISSRIDPSDPSRHSSGADAATLTITTPEPSGM